MHLGLGALPVAGQSYTVTKDDTSGLSGIASRAYNVTGYRSWDPFGCAIYNKNKAMIDAEAARRGKPKPYYNWIFPGQVLSLPTYDEAAGVKAPTWVPSTPGMAPPSAQPPAPGVPPAPPTPAIRESSLPLILGGVVVFGLLYMLFKKKS